jgi:hypothetical protein
LAIGDRLTLHAAASALHLHRALHLCCSISAPSLFAAHSVGAGAGAPPMGRCLAAASCPCQAPASTVSTAALATSCRRMVPSGTSACPACCQIVRARAAHHMLPLGPLHSGYVSHFIGSANPCITTRPPCSAAVVPCTVGTGSCVLPRPALSDHLHAAPAPTQLREGTDGVEQALFRTANTTFQGSPRTLSGGWGCCCCSHWLPGRC